MNVRNFLWAAALAAMPMLHADTPADIEKSIQAINKCANYTTEEGQSLAEPDRANLQLIVSRYAAFFPEEKTELAAALQTALTTNLYYDPNDGTWKNASILAAATEAPPAETQ